MKGSCLAAKINMRQTEKSLGSVQTRNQKAGSLMENLGSGNSQRDDNFQSILAHSNAQFLQRGWEVSHPPFFLSLVGSVNIKHTHHDSGHSGSAYVN